LSKGVEGNLYGRDESEGAEYRKRGIREEEKRVK